MPDPLPAHWRAAEEACRAWTKTRERPHPPLPEVVRYVIPAGTLTWIGGAMTRNGMMATIKEDLILPHPPTHDGYPAVEQDANGRWAPAAQLTRQRSVAYHIVPVDLQLYEHLFRAGLLDPPPAPFVDNRDPRKA